jgi:hypothetical protein
MEIDFSSDSDIGAPRRRIQAARANARIPQWVGTTAHLI